MSDQRATESALTKSLARPPDGARDAYPYPSRPAVTAIMRGNKKTDTRPEVLLRSALHRAGARFRKHYRVRVDEGRPIVIDVAFPRHMLAVFVDGCFWHSCPDHGTTPRSNATYWRTKLGGNVERDRATNERLTTAGWQVVRVWEHADSASAAAAVLEALHSLKDRPSSALQGKPS